MASLVLGHDRILEIAREIVEGCEGVIANVERLAMELPHQPPLDCEGFRVALFYARKVLAAAERGEWDEIDPAWLEPIERIGMIPVHPKNPSAAGLAEVGAA